MVDAPVKLILGVATSTLPVLHIKAGNTSIIGKWGSIARGL